MPDFLLEIGCEEIPARMIDDTRNALASGLIEVLKDELRLWDDFQESPSRPRLQSFSTPRRLAVVLRGIRVRQSDIEEQVQGPAVKIAFKDGQPTPAALAFSKKVGKEISDLQTVATTKGEYLTARIVKKGRSAKEVLSEVLPAMVRDLYWPKTMYWRVPSERFVRPVRWLIAMLDEEVVPLEFVGVSASSDSRGHRILSTESVKVNSPDSYEQALERANVIADQAKRRTKIREELVGKAGSNLRYRLDEKLLDKVTNLAEYPTVTLGSFDPEFLKLPEEVLVTVMRDHQNYFAVEDANGKLAPHFLAVLNTDGDRDGTIQHGNERVLRARFNDARFFWQTDQKISLRDRLELLKHVTFQKDLGSYYDKTIRTQRLASSLSEIARQGGVTLRPGIVHKSACLAKTDLTTELVKEFTELQGIVGGLYARVQVLDEHLGDDVRQGVSVAIYDHYKPESMEDSVPRTIEGAILAVADKADSIAGMFALGLIPSGSKDPFGLRRQANGIVKTIAEHQLPFGLRALIRDARVRYRGSEAEKKFAADAAFEEATRSFFRERLEFYLRDAKGFAYDVVNAVLVADADDVVDALARAEAVAKVRPSSDFESISIAFKRMKNILRQASEAGREVGSSVNPSILKEDAEKQLATQVPLTAERVRALKAERKYEDALLEIAKLRPAVDLFFDKVMVMVDDPAVRANRLALLQTLVNEFSTIADFSEIVTEGKESK